MTRAVEWAGEVRLRIRANAVFDFVRDSVDVDPVHDGSGVSDGGDKAFVGGIGVREVVACVGVAVPCSRAGAGVNP